MGWAIKVLISMISPRRARGGILISTRAIAALPQPESAGDDAAQDLAGAAAQGPGRRVQDSLGQHLLEPVVCGAAAARRQQARNLRDLALQSVAEVLDKSGFE